MSTIDSVYKQILELAELEDTDMNRLEIDAALDYANTYCKTSYPLTELPAGFKKAITILLRSMDQPLNINSESIGGEMSVKYREDLTSTAKEYLDAYRRIVFH